MAPPKRIIALGAGRRALAARTQLRLEKALKEWRLWYADFQNKPLRTDNPLTKWQDKCNNVLLATSPVEVHPEMPMFKVWKDWECQYSLDSENHPEIIFTKDNWQFVASAKNFKQLDESINDRVFKQGSTGQDLDELKIDALFEFTFKHDPLGPDCSAAIKEFGTVDGECTGIDCLNWTMKDSLKARWSALEEPPVPSQEVSELMAVLNDGNTFFSCSSQSGCRATYRCTLEAQSSSCP